MIQRPSAEAQRWNDVRYVLETKGRPHRGDPDAAWQPRRQVFHAVLCSSCWEYIPAGAPGNTKGTRGTKAWFNPIWGLWECLSCHTDRVEWEERCLAWDQLDPDTQRAIMWGERSFASLPIPELQQEAIRCAS